jgi:uncharacterized Tic20 family protein
VTEQPQNASSTPVIYQPQPMLESDARMWSMLINVAAVAGAVLSGGMLGLVAVLVIWLVYRERSALVDFHGKQQLNLAITIVLATVAYLILGLMTLGVVLVIGLIPMAAYFIYVVVISIIAAVAANRGEYYKIPLVIPFIK